MPDNRPPRFTGTTGPTGSTGQPAVDYKGTLNLPKTDFAMKADLPKREPEVLAQWESLPLYQRIQQARAKAATTFVLHDGPPYANGDIHIGHALNKILKDIIVRYRTMRGDASPYVPGWDCHGMPIEHQLFKELKITKHQIGQVEFRQKARAYAERYVGIQREQFKRLGVLGDWEHPYLTMAPEYELAIVRTFNALMKQGRIYRGRKPVYWCPNCETALAEAEVEYEDQTDTSLYVKFKLPQQYVEKLNTLIISLQPPPGFSSLSACYLLIWTTTPWTLPANVAVAVNPYQAYSIVPMGNGEAVIVAQERAGKIPETAGQPVSWGLGESLVDLCYERPFATSPGRVVTDEYVSMDEGTGLVHIAPGHGQEDYLIGTRCGLDVLSPVNEQGRFTKDVGVPELEGLRVADANAVIIKNLTDRGLLLREQPITHSYPHCWRCKKPIIFRAASQWFLKVDPELRQQLLDAAKRVEWIPDVGQSRMRGMLENRPDWCLSRQRYWGSPIPVLHCQTCDEPLTDPKLLDEIERTLTERGVEGWFSLSPAELAPSARCPKDASHPLRKDADILDVWFDSGVSHEAVLRQRPELTWPAAMYLEGSDQHRGWFQVSLITSVALSGQAPYERVLTHGFVMDGEGRKMSKSLGNVIAPQQVIQRYGADVLRLWVASSDYREDVRISEAILERVAEAYRKIRNTIRYLLSNLSDFDPARDAQPLASLPELDRWVLMRAQQVLAAVTAAYDTYQFHQAFQQLYQFCVLDLSACYLDALKDRLYTEGRASAKRRCAQTTLHVILARVVGVMSPILAFTAEESWQAMRALRMVTEESAHLARWPQAMILQEDPALLQRWGRWLAMRDVVMKALEQERAKNVIGSPLEAEVTLGLVDEGLRRQAESAKAELEEFFVVSGVQVEAAKGGPAEAGPVPGLAWVRVERARGLKCVRCWKYRGDIGTSSEHPQLCARCVAAVTGEPIRHDG